jgi:dihydroorotate dehydrogenase
MYKALIRPIFFLFPPEKAHHLTTSLFTALSKIPGIKQLIRSMFIIQDKRLERDILGLKFPNPVGLAAGFDKEAKLYNSFKHIGFGFIEVGTITPKGQPGNPKPRMFRLPHDGGLINRMGFNNEGVAEAVKNLKKRKGDLIIGGNIGKNKITPNEEAKDDYLKCFEALYPHVDYFVVNVSSPNTPNRQANDHKQVAKPVFLKIAPDLTESQLFDIVEIAQSGVVDGLIATNTTIERKNLRSEPNRVAEAGGLSGKPVRERSTEVIRFLRSKLPKPFPIIGVGGITDEESAWEKIEAGADLIQVYTGLIYEGPALIKRINKYILKRHV